MMHSGGGGHQPTVSPRSLGRAGSWLVSQPSRRSGTLTGWAAAGPRVDAPERVQERVGPAHPGNRFVGDVVECGRFLLGQPMAEMCNNALIAELRDAGVIA